MIIVSQYKDIIVNFDKVESIWIDDNVLDKTNCNFDIIAGEETIGSYKTEERAKEVLQEIIDMYSKIYGTRRWTSNNTRRNGYATECF